MNKKQAKMLAAVFAKPVSGTIDWADIERLLIAAGCETIEGSGSRVKFVKDKTIASFHRPHPDKQAKHYQVRNARESLEKIGVTP